ncbi:ciab protein [Helicobacter sp. MIT 05-5293]|uniref:invasion protein CiaB n=1 Tax=Helicobacter sp. MIT 05-5293 TaxID=1548149 RepID=UPI00051D241A|nr:invasion protein CiaB [Helicobacter sp. MIT 05-5293]TLD82119.1 ciab protein [Helicobacter sp. MIT 05-5293]
MDTSSHQITFESHLKLIYEMAKESIKTTNEFFRVLENDDASLQIHYTTLEHLAQKLEIPTSKANLMALAQRIVNLREDSILQVLEDSEKYHSLAQDSQKQAKEWLKSCQYQLLEFVRDYYNQAHQAILDRISQEQLLSAFYREILFGVHRIGQAMNEFFKVWNQTLIDEINTAFSEKYDFSQALHLLQPTLDKDSQGEYVGRSYSIPILVDKSSQQEIYASLPYKKAFPLQVASITKAIDQTVESLASLEDSIYHKKEAYIAYFVALKRAWNEEDSTQLITQWQSVDMAWMDIDTPLQIAHPLEYYEDIYRHSVAPEWDLRLSKSQKAHQNTALQVQKMFEKIASQIHCDEDLKHFVLASLSQTTLYNALPLLFYGAELNGLFSAQVVPNDEWVSSQKGKKIFAFPDRILMQNRAKPKMKLQYEIFDRDFLEKARGVMFDNEDLWYQIYDISTNGHEFGHILWVDEHTESVMNIDGEFKNIEEFKATCGGLMAYFITLTPQDLHASNALLDALLSDHIRRAVGLMAWRTSTEVRPYYCEGLLHLSGMFESGVLSFDAHQSPKLQIHTRHYKELLAWYQEAYLSLSQHYVDKRPSKIWLESYVINDKGLHKAKNPAVDAFVEYYWERYKLIGQEIL